MNLTRFLLTMLVILASASIALAQPSGSPVWTDFAGPACLVNGNPMPVGSRIDAYDPAGVLCGQKFASVAGVYPFMPVYGDYGDSPEDEGCVLGDHVVFRVNGIVAAKLGPESDTWDGQGATKIMNLSTVQSFLVDVVGPDGGTGEAGTNVSYTVSIDNDGNGLDWIHVSLSHNLGWILTHNQSTLDFYLEPGASKSIVVTVHIPGSAGVGTEGILTVTANSKFDAGTTDSKNITTTVDQSTDVDESDYVIPGAFSLAQNYPNPFNPETNISFSLDKGADIRLEVFDILGRKVSTLFAGNLGAGQHEFTWRGIDESGRQSASGIYFYRLSSNEFSLTRKMTLLK